MSRGLEAIRRDVERAKGQAAFFPGCQVLEVFAEVDRLRELCGMTDDVERVARALYEHDREHGTVSVSAEPWDELPETSREYRRGFARAAIDALCPHHNRKGEDRIGAPVVCEDCGLTIGRMVFETGPSAASAQHRETGA